MLSALKTQAAPLMENVAALATSLDSLAGKLDQVVKDIHAREIMTNLAESASSLKALLKKGGHLDASLENVESITALLTENEEKIDSLLTNFQKVSSDLAAAELDSLSLNMQLLLKQAGLLVEHVNSGEGSAGAFIYSDSLYHSLTRLITDLDSLVNDLAENPEDYVQISVFGKSDRKK